MSLHRSFHPRFLKSPLPSLGVSPTHETTWQSVEAKESKAALPMTKVARKPARQTKAAKRGAPAKKGRKSKKAGRKGRLSDVSASSVSLQDAADFVGAVWKYGSYALALVNAEEKQSYTLQANGVITNTTIYNVVAIAQGSDYNQRLGDSIKMENLRLDYTLQVNVTAGVNQTRIIVLRDFMNLGAFPAAADIFQDTTSQNAEILSPFLHSLGDRFEVLSDVTHMSVLATDTALVHRRFAFGINDHMLFKGTTAAIGDTWQGMVFMVVVTDQAVNGPKLIASTLLTYVDN